MKRIVYINEKTINFNDNKIKFSELFTSEFYHYVNNSTDELYHFGTPADNVIFCYHVLPLLSLYYFLYNNKIEEIIVGSVDEADSYRIVNVAKMLNISCNITEKYGLELLVHFKNYLTIIGTMIYLLIFEAFVKYDEEIVPKGEKLFLIRQTSAKEKIRTKANDFVLEESSIGKGTFYQVHPYRKRATMIFKSFFQSIKMYHRLKNEFRIKKLREMGIPVLTFLSIRLVHINLWGNLIEIILSKYPDIHTVITGAYLDSYSQVEQNVVKKYNCKLIVVPHGLEDEIRYPSGLTGDLFYATSLTAERKLNELYCTNKFIYNRNMLISMYKKEFLNVKRRFVYFTTGSNDDVDVKITMHIAHLLKLNEEKLYLKFKPKTDLTPFSALDNTAVINSISEAICGNVCISRGSAVLVEALYNNSVSIQIILPEDGVMRAQIIPSLADDKILHFYSLEEFDTWFARNFK